LPGLARGGTTLVVSPLIALMEDQVAKLQALGLRAERIHSGRDRVLSREALRAYSEGRLDFLFVAPERLSVPGFCEALARKTPGLVAVDEAHCISEWGHDFRPDYRLLGERLPQLRPAPVIALTATATPRVQDDIAGQLGLQPLRFIHGFRRENIAIEIARLVPSLRPDVVARVLASRAQRPAIVYTPTRREADELGRALARRFPTAAYHAGMTTAARDRVQADFLSGRLEVIVATIAFGMGVDKADIRTVIHTALPGTLEGFSQEIGRAGRDGKPSRALLLHSWNDRRTHEYFFDRGYPEPEVLQRVFRALPAEPARPEGLARRLRLESEVVEAALEKLWIHGGARYSQLAGAQLVARGREGWEPRYRLQREHRRSQLDQVQRFADDHSCRMAALVAHFGDREDRGQACGTCDVCDPGACLVRTTRPPTPKERAAAAVVLESLRGRDGQSTGRLHAECAEAGLDRHGFEEVLGGLARAGLLRIAADTFSKDGQDIAFKRAWLTSAASAGGVLFTLAAEPEARASAPKRRKKGKATKDKPSRRKPAVDSALADALTAWRLAEARRAGVPAFRVLQNKTLSGIAAARPQDEAALLAVPGFGPTLLRRYGKRILALCGAS
ncbi:MAG: RecQ family ATP-dependent DNA helicase, partial [Vicinamibacteria bacterium]|nr:RecQ family ATP-dependent DNA helicase [Vicinamibacteria bacterium]